MGRSDTRPLLHAATDDTGSVAINAPDGRAAAQYAPVTATQLVKTAIVVLVFSLHNGWNCFVFLDFSNYGPCKELLSINDSQLGFVNSMGWVGILSTLPLVTVCRWHRTLLFIAGFVNAAAPALRYYAAITHDYQLMTLSSVLVGSVYGIIGAWPPMLARLMLPNKPEWWTLVTAIASLANYIGGAVGTTLLPAITETAEDLKEVLRLQAYVGAGLGVLMLSWLWIPAVVDAPGKLSVIGELRVCCRGPVLAQILVFGIFIGLSLLLQGMNNFIIEKSGFSAFEGGLANTVYQSIAAVVGICLGGFLAGRERSVIKWLHWVSLVAFAGLFTLCWHVHADGAFRGAIPVMLATMAVLGGSLMGALPFVLHTTIEAAHPASENMVAGLIFFVAISIAAAGTQIVSIIPVLTSLWIIGGGLVLEMLLFYSVAREK